MPGRNAGDVYVCEDVADVEALHPYLAGAEFKALPISEQLDRQARTLFAAHCGGDRRVKTQIACWLPGAARKSIDAILAAPFTLDDARLTIAREYGFKDWAAVLQTGDRAPDAPFEEAVDALVAGNLPLLKQMLDADPGLIHARSCYGHRATLLHYHRRERRRDHTGRRRRSTRWRSRGCSSSAARTSMRGGNVWRRPDRPGPGRDQRASGGGRCRRTAHRTAQIRAR